MVAARAVIALCVLIVVTSAYGAELASPQERYDAARRLMQSGRYSEAAVAFSDVANAADAPIDLQRQALFVAGLMYQQARDYPRAVATYDDVQRRFPDTEAAQRAAGSAHELRAGSSRWLEFRQRQDEAWDVFEPAKTRAETEGAWAAHDDLERAATLLRALLDDFPEHPRAKDVAVALASTLLSLRRFGESAATYDRAVELARRQSAESGIPIDSFLTVALDDRHAAVRAGRRYYLTATAVGILAVAALGLVALRPWRTALRASAPTLRAVGLLVAALAVGSPLIAVLVRRFVDENSPLTPLPAIVLTALPAAIGGVTAVLYAEGLLARLPRREAYAYGAAAAVAALAALATSVCVMSHFDLLSFLDSEL